MMTGQLESRVKLDESHYVCSRIGWWGSQANEELTHGRPGHGGEPKRRLYFRISHFTSPFYFSHCVLFCNLASFSHPANSHVHISRIHRLREFLGGSPPPPLPFFSPAIQRPGRAAHTKYSSYRCSDNPAQYNHILHNGPSFKNWFIIYMIA